MQASVDPQNRSNSRRSHRQRVSQHAPPLTRRVHLDVLNLDPNHFAVQRRSLTPLGKQRHLPRA